jgi:hypothetical protein
MQNDKKESQIIATTDISSQGGRRAFLAVSWAELREWLDGGFRRARCVAVVSGAPSRLGDKPLL